MKRFLLRFFHFLQLHRLLRYWRRNKVVILTYHGFTDKLSHPGIENHQGKHLLIERFKCHLEYIKKYHPIISLETLIDDYKEHRNPPAGAVVITFDDGYESNYTLAFPVLRQFNAPASIFVTTGFVDEKKYLWTDRVEYAVSEALPGRFEFSAGYAEGRRRSYLVETQNSDTKRESEKNLRAGLKAIPQEFRLAAVEALENRLEHYLSRAGNIPAIYKPLEWAQINEMLNSGLVSVGSHSHTHPILSKCREEDLGAELLTSKRIIEAKTGKACRLFCYPNGQAGDFNQSTKEMLRHAGYECGLSSIPGVNDVNSDVFELRRLGVPYQGDMADFVMNFYGFTQFLSDIKSFFMKLFRSGKGCQGANQ